MASGYIESLAQGPQIMQAVAGQPVMQAAAGEPIMQAAAGSPDGIGVPLAQPVQGTANGARSLLRVAYGLLGTAGMAVGAYHGYKRNHGSYGWAIGWAFFGAVLPIIALPVAFAQGVGKPKRG